MNKNTFPLPNKEELKKTVFNILQNHVVWSYVPEDSEVSQEDLLEKASVQIVKITLDNMLECVRNIQERSEDFNEEGWSIDFNQFSEDINEIECFVDDKE